MFGMIIQGYGIRQRNGGEQRRCAAHPDSLSYKGQYSTRDGMRSLLMRYFRTDLRFTGARFMTIGALAVYEAVNATTGTLATLPRDHATQAPGASAEAAGGDGFA